MHPFTVKSLLEAPPLIEAPPKDPAQWHVIEAPPKIILQRKPRGWTQLLEHIGLALIFHFYQWALAVSIAFES